MIVDYWPDFFRRLYGGSWPTSYCCIDSETTGYSLNQDVVTEWGHVLVQDGQVVDRLSLVVDWTEHAVVPDYWLRSRLLVLKQQMELAGKVCHSSYERMKAEGTKPAEAFGFVRDFVKTLQGRGVLFVGHNASFDERMLAACFAGFKVAPGFSFGDNGLLDTEAIEKASQYPDNPRMHPTAKDTLRSYFHRVRYSRITGSRSSMEHCHTKYRLDECGVPREGLHGAETDAFCVHLLFEKFRAMIGGPKTPPFPGEAHKAERRGTGAALAPPVPPGPPGRRVRGQRWT